MIATIITDASHHPCGDAGWAGRIIRNGRRYTWSAKLKGEIATSNDAEFAAVVNTIYLGVKTRVLQAGDKLLVELDNQHAARVLEKVYNPLKKSNLAISEYQKRCIGVLINAMADLGPASVEIRHVKAHVPLANREARHHVHTVMDKLAKKARLS
jgi:ribonuclease HI